MNKPIESAIVLKIKMFQIYYEDLGCPTNNRNTPTFSLWKLIALTDPLVMKFIKCTSFNILAYFCNLIHAGKVSDIKSELQLCCFKMNNVYWVRHWVKGLACSVRKIFVSVVGKADSLAYAASLLDRETWEWEQIANLATKANATLVTMSVVSRRIFVWLQVTLICSSFFRKYSYELKTFKQTSGLKFSEKKFPGIRQWTHSYCPTQSVNKKR